jgi:hypothetical protein
MERWLLLSTAGEQAMAEEAVMQQLQEVLSVNW